MTYDSQEEEEDSIGVFLNSLDNAGYVKEYIRENHKHWIRTCFNGLDFCTVDELIDFLDLNGDGDFETDGRKYVLGYFGGSGSIKIKFNKGKKKGTKRSELTRERKRDSSGRFIY